MFLARDAPGECSCSKTLFLKSLSVPLRYIFAYFFFDGLTLFFVWARFWAYVFSRKLYLKDLSGRKAKYIPGRGRGRAEPGPGQADPSPSGRIGARTGGALHSTSNLSFRPPNADNRSERLFWHERRIQSYINRIQNHQND